MITKNPCRYFSLVLLWAGILCFICGAASLISYEDTGNSLNKEETAEPNYEPRLNVFSSLVESLLKDVREKKLEGEKYLLKARKIFLVGKIGRLKLEKNTEFFHYFDLVLYNLIFYRNQFDQGRNVQMIRPKMQPRLTRSVIQQFNTRTTFRTYAVRRSFIIDFYLSSCQNKLTASEKVRLMAYIDSPLHDKPREGIRNTDIVLNIIRPYLHFSESELVKNLFDFNNKSSEVSASVSSPMPDELVPSKPFKSHAPLIDVVKKSIPESVLKEQKLINWILVASVIIVSILLAYLLLRKKPPLESAQSTKVFKEPSSLRTPFSIQDMILEPSKPHPDYVAPTKLDAVSQMMIQTLPDRYENIWKVSKGGMGVIFGAHDKFLKRKVAIKMISPTLCDDENLVQRFINEARSVASLDHPHILKIYDVGMGQYPFFVMEFLEGVTLDELINSKRKLNSEEIKYYGLQMADALNYCHQKGIIHRDIKPSNIFIVNNNRFVKLIDFGIAKNQDMTGLTRSDVTLGSASYMAPEQLKSNSSGVHSDIYSFGLVLYKMA
ncbi:MAG: serine/threonine protein kinase, partial [Candidatus Aureabacteria bacterium]|nr:serine/threonine protein kinase [Candidatus Auribacterota bacterium]